MAAPLEFDKMAVLIWFFTTAPRDKVVAGTITVNDLGSVAAAFTPGEQQDFNDIAAVLNGFGADFARAQDLFQRVLQAGSALWDTDHTVTTLQVRRIWLLQAYNRLLEFEEASYLEGLQNKR
jgi:hypothetical protein